MTERFIEILSSLTAPESAATIYKKLVTGLDKLQVVTYRVIPENEESRLPSATRHGGDPIRAEIPEDILQRLLSDEFFVNVLNEAKGSSNQGVGRKGASLVKKALNQYFDRVLQESI